MHNNHGNCIYILRLKYVIYTTASNTLRQPYRFRSDLSSWHPHSHRPRWRDPSCVLLIVSNKVSLFSPCVSRSSFSCLEYLRQVAQIHPTDPLTPGGRPYKRSAVRRYICAAPITVTHSESHARCTDNVARRTIIEGSGHNQLRTSASIESYQSVGGACHVSEAPRIESEVIAGDAVSDKIGSGGGGAVLVQL